MARVIGINSSVDTTGEHIISAGGSLTFPSACVHNIASDSAQDDWDGVKQVETATAVGTIAGVKQVETLTVLGTIGASGAGDATVVVTGALVTGSPVTYQVAVANNDTASAVAGKVRVALAASDKVTTAYTVGGSGATVTLTPITAAANDATLNISIDNGTCTGLTAVPTSTNTTSGTVTSLTASVVVTAAGVTGSPITLSVAVTNGDTAATWAGKVRNAITGNTAISAVYTVGGAGAAISLTAKTVAANDGTLNIALDNSNCTGITPASSSADTTGGVAGTGAKSIRIYGVDQNGTQTTEVVRLQGTTNVATTKQYVLINSMEVEAVGSGGSNAGVITGTATTGSTVTSTIATGANISKYAIWRNGTNGTMKITSLSVLCANSGSAATTLEFLIRKSNGVTITQYSEDIADNGTFTNVTPLPAIRPGETLILKATAASGTTAVTAYINIE